MIQNIVTFILVIIPIILIMWYINERDNKEKEPLILIVIMILLGIISVCLSRWVWKLIIINIPEIKEEIASRDWYVRILISYGQIGFIEETIKYIILNILIYRNKNYDYMYDGIVYSVALSLGFALMEGIEYGMKTNLIVSLVRSILTIPMHTVYGVMMGYYMSKGKIDNNNRVMYYRYVGLILPIFIHGTSDYMLSILNSNNQLIYIGWAIFLYIGSLKKINELSKFDKKI